MTKTGVVPPQALIGLDEFQLAIPQRVGLHQSPPLLRQPGPSMQYTHSGRKTRSNIKLGICGEHGGDPESVVYCHKIGLTYVSCSPFRVLTARLAAAQAAATDKLKTEGGRTR